MDFCCAACARLSNVSWVSLFSASMRSAIFGSPVARAFICARFNTVSSTSDASRAGESEFMIWLMNPALRSTVWNM